MLVETWTDADGEPLTTIDYIWNDTAGAKPPWKTVTLGKSVPLSHASALRWAVWFAASRNVPVVYKRDEAINHGYAAAQNAAARPSLSSLPK